LSHLHLPKDHLPSLLKLFIVGFYTTIHTLLNAPDPMVGELLIRLKNKVIPTFLVFIPSAHSYLFMCGASGA
jgi:hypothetical protein